MPIHTGSTKMDSVGLSTHKAGGNRFAGLGINWEGGDVYVHMIKTCYVCIYEILKQLNKEVMYGVLCP